MLLSLSIGIVTRIIPHIPNFSPEIVFALYLGIQFNKIRATIFILAMAIISDVIIGLSSGYPIFGTWIMFTYSALIVSGLLGTKRWIRQSKAGFLLSGLLLTVGFWVWTNFGVWLLSGMYPHTGIGFIACYTLALPFLNTALAGSLVWAIVIIGYEYCLAYFHFRRRPLLQTN